jgi:SAM-dependent methyltransferase
MSAPPRLTDRAALARNRARAARGPGDALILHDIAEAALQERLNLVNRSFRAPALVTGHPARWAAVLPGARVIADAPTLDLCPGAHDLIVHAMALHWADDPVGQLIQARRALRPDGLFLAVFFGGETLGELRAALARAEAEIAGGLAPRIAPMADVRDAGGLLQRAGYALPVADTDRVRLSYGDAWALMRDLRAMGEANALIARHRAPPSRHLFRRAADIYRARFADPENPGRVRATFDLIWLTGWAPGPGQPQPLRPGSARVRLADALGTTEFRPPDPPGRRLDLPRRDANTGKAPKEPE